MARVKQKELEYRLDEYSKDLKEIKENLKKDPTIPNAKKAVEYIDKEGIGTLLEDEYGGNPMKSLRSLRNDQWGAVDIASIGKLIGFLITAFSLVRKKMKQYKYIPKWKATPDVNPLTYHISEASDLYERCVERMKSRPSKRDIGLVFGRVTPANRIIVHGVMSLNNILSVSSELEEKDKKYEKLYVSTWNLKNSLIKFKREEIAEEFVHMGEALFKGGKKLYSKKNIQELFGE